MRMPFDGNYPVSYLGSYQDHINAGGDRSDYAGIDWGMPIGTPLYAIESGSVQSWTDKFGAKYVMLTGATGVWFYVHLDSFAVTSGNVEEGQLIGYSGSTGFTSGPHLHLGLRINGAYVDPQKYLNFNNQNMDEIRGIICNKDNDIGDALRVAGIKDPGDKSQQQNCANLNKTWLSFNGDIKSHNGNLDDFLSKLKVGDWVIVRGNPSDATPSRPSGGSNPEAEQKARNYDELQKSIKKLIS